MSDYPEHDKLRAAKRDSQVIGEFLSWLAETHRTVCEPCPAEGYVPITLRTEQLLAEYFNIDLTKIEDERQAMLRVLRTQGPSDQGTDPDRAHPSQRGKPPQSTVCARCGSPLSEGLCTDETCPFNAHEQGCPTGWAGHPERHPFGDRDAMPEDCTCQRRVQ